MEVELGLDYLEINMNRKESLLILFSAVESKLFSVSDIHSWADNILSEVSKPQHWLYELAYESNNEVILNILRSSISENRLMFDDNYWEMQFACLCLSLKKNSIGLSEFKTEVIDLLDAYEVSSIDIEELLSENDVFSNSAFIKYVNDAKALIQWLGSLEMIKSQIHLFEI